MHLSMKRFPNFFLLVLFFNPLRSLLLSVSSETKLFDLDTLPHGSLTFLGDSYPQNGTNAFALTKEGMLTDAPGSTGMVFYSRPISFLHPHLRKVHSFSTMFAFTMRNMYGDDGDGLAFLISADDHLGSPGYLGLVDSANITRNKFIAIEFDTKCDPIFQDPDDNHLGLDINNLFSVQLVTSSSLGMSLKSGDLIRTWIDYKSDEKRFEVFLSNLKLKPVKPLLKVDIDLSNYLNENMFVGFSAATEGRMQFTSIEQWEFTIAEFRPTPPPSPSPESGRTFPTPSEFGQRHSHFSRLAIGLTVGVCSVPFIAAFGWFCWKNMGIIQKLEGTNHIEMQTIKPSGGTSEIRLSIPGINPDEVARGLIIDKVFDNETQLIRVKTVKCSIPFSVTFSQQ